MKDQGTAKPLQTRYELTFITVIALIGGAIWIGVQFVQMARYAPVALAGEEWRALHLQITQDHSDMGRSASHVAVVILLIFWVFQSRRNLALLGVHNLEIPDIMVWLGFIVPLMNLFVPAAAIAEVWKASDPRRLGEVLWKKASSWFLFIPWGLVNAMAALYVRVLADMDIPDDIAGTRAAVETIQAYNAAMLVYAISTIVIVVWTTIRLRQKDILLSDLNSRIAAARDLVGRPEEERTGPNLQAALTEVDAVIAQVPDLAAAHFARGGNFERPRPDSRGHGGLPGGGTAGPGEKWRLWPAGVGGTALGNEIGGVRGRTRISQPAP